MKKNTPLPKYPFHFPTNVQNKPKYVDKWTKCSGFLSCNGSMGKGVMTVNGAEKGFSQK